MRDAIERKLKFSVACLVVVSHVGLTSTFRFGPSLVLLPVLVLALMPVCESLDRRYGWYRQMTSYMILAYLVCLPFIVRTFALLDAVISLVMIIQVYSLLHVKTARSYGHIVLMSFFLLLAASVMSPRAEIALAFALFVILAARTLVLLEMFSGMTRAGKAIQIQLVAGPKGPSGGEVSVLDSRLSMVVMSFAVVVIGLTVAIFAFAPRTEAGILGRTNSTPRFETGLSTELDLSEGGTLQGNAGPVMRVQFPEEEGGQYRGELLWRSSALDSYTGKSWTRRGLFTPVRPNAGPGVRRFKNSSRTPSLDGLSRPGFGIGRDVYQEIFLDRPPEVGVPVLPMVRAIFPSDTAKRIKLRWDITGDFTAIMSRDSESGISINVWSEVVEPSIGQLRSAGSDYSSVMVDGDFRQLTYENLLPDTLDVIEGLVEGETTNYDKVMALQSWLQTGNFVYSQEIPFLPEENPVDAFLLDEKRGHCQLYASGLALMVRSQGIPARVVRGYRGGTWDASDRSYTITNDMAHLWTEVFFPGIGWVAFDPSPPEGDPATFSIDSFVRSYSRYILRARLFWLRNVVSFRSGTTSEWLKNLAGGAANTFSVPWGSVSSSDAEIPLLKRIYGWAIFLVAIAGVAGMAYLLISRGPRRKRKRPGGVLTSDQKRAVKLHGLLAKKFRRLGLDVNGRTTEEIEERLESVTLNDRASALRLLETYNATRFGLQGLPPSAFAELKGRVRSLRLIAK